MGHFFMSPKKRRGAPDKNGNAVKHGGYASTKSQPDAITGPDSTGAADATAPATAVKNIPSLEDIILDLVAHQKTLAQYIESQNYPDTLTALNLYGQNSSRLARMVKMVDNLGGPDKARQMYDAAREAIEAFGEEMGIQLGKG